MVYFPQLARAEKGLQDELNSGKTFNDAESAEILLEIARGLAEVADIVHRTNSLKTLLWPRMLDRSNSNRAALLQD